MLNSINITFQHFIGAQTPVKIQHSNRELYCCKKNAEYRQNNVSNLRIQRRFLRYRTSQHFISQKFWGLNLEWCLGSQRLCQNTEFLYRVLSEFSSMELRKMRKNAEKLVYRLHNDYKYSKYLEKGAWACKKAGSLGNWRIRIHYSWLLFNGPAELSASYSTWTIRGLWIYYS